MYLPTATLFPKRPLRAEKVLQIFLFQAGSEHPQLTVTQTAQLSSSDPRISDGIKSRRDGHCFSQEKHRKKDCADWETLQWDSQSLDQLMVQSGNSQEIGDVG